MLPDVTYRRDPFDPHGSQCTYRCVVLPDADQFEMITTFKVGLNAPTGAWCSLTTIEIQDYRKESKVSMHLQVRGAP